MSEGSDPDPAPDSDSDSGPGSGAAPDVAAGSGPPGVAPDDWVGDWSARRARLSPDRVGLVDATTGREFTYADLDARAVRVARTLRERGIEHGDRVAVVSRNRPELVDLFFATGKLGAVLAPLSHRLAPPELGELLGVVDPDLLVVEAGFADLLAEALASAETPVRADATGEPAVLTLGTREADAPEGNPAGPEGGGSTRRLEGDPWERALVDRRGGAAAGSDVPFERPDVDLADPHLLLHTGGSTGVPKETVVPHRSILWNAVNTVTAWGLRPRDTTPMTFPMFHTGGWNVITVPLFHLGGTVVVAREFDPGGVLETVEKRSATVLIAVPAVLRMMATHDDWAARDVSSLRFAKSGGGPCRESVLEAWWDRGVDLSQGYGLTECGPNNFAMPTDWPREKADSVGVPVMHVDARVVDEAGEPLPDGEVGELELAGPHAAAGYLDRPEATAETFGGGWVSTGDLARVDADGYYHIVGRKKNMFVSGGENVYPPAVEDVVAGHPKVTEVVVIGVDDPEWGQVGKAVVEGDESLTIEELRAYLDGRLARFKHPRHLAFVDEMPTSGPSKLDREAVRERFGE